MHIRRTMLRAPDNDLDSIVIFPPQPNTSFVSVITLHRYNGVDSPFPLIQILVRDGEVHVDSAPNERYNFFRAAPFTPILGGNCFLRTTDDTVTKANVAVVHSPPGETPGPLTAPVVRRRLENGQMMCQMDICPITIANTLGERPDGHQPTIADDQARLTSLPEEVSRLGELITTVIRLTPEETPEETDTSMST